MSELFFLDAAFKCLYFYPFHFSQAQPSTLSNTLTLTFSFTRPNPHSHPHTTTHSLAQSLAPYLSLFTHSLARSRTRTHACMHASTHAHSHGKCAQSDVPTHVKTSTSLMLLQTGTTMSCSSKQTSSLASAAMGTAFPSWPILLRSRSSFRFRMCMIFTQDCANIGQPSLPSQDPFLKVP